jgi:hypothetical protein
MTAIFDHEGNPKRLIEIGTFANGLPEIIHIPTGGLATADKVFAAERAKRELEAERARGQAKVSAARKLRRVLTTMLGRRP